MTRLANEISVLKFMRADRSSEFDGLLAQIDPRGPSRARGSCYDGSTTRRTGDQRRCRNVKGFINANIMARVSGYVISQNYEQGSVVKKGDLLFQIDPRPFEEESARGQEVAQRLSDSAVPV
jgi:hypothetical protein